MNKISQLILEKAREGIFNNDNDLIIDTVESIRNVLPYLGEWTSEEINQYFKTV